jgi:hypothetical protein
MTRGKRASARGAVPGLKLHLRAMARDFAELGFDQDRIWTPPVRTLRRARRGRRS